MRPTFDPAVPATQRTIPSYDSTSDPYCPLTKSSKFQQRQRRQARDGQEGTAAGSRGLRRAGAAVVGAEGGGPPPPPSKITFQAPSVTDPYLEMEAVKLILLREGYLKRLNTALRSVDPGLDPAAPLLDLIALLRECTLQTATAIARCSAASADSTAGSAGAHGGSRASLYTHDDGGEGAEPAWAVGGGGGGGSVSLAGGSVASGSVPADGSVASGSARWAASARAPSPTPSGSRGTLPAARRGGRSTHGSRGAGPHSVAGASVVSGVEGLPPEKPEANPLGLPPFPWKGLDYSAKLASDLNHLDACGGVARWLRARRVPSMVAFVFQGSPFPVPPGPL